MQSIDLQQIRIAYKETVQDKSKVVQFNKQLSLVSKSSKPELVAYKGASIALVARKAKTIKEKKSGFLKGIALVEYAIKKTPNNIEARFVRLSIQENTPKLLKYKENITEDKQFIYKQFPLIKNTSLKKYLKAYILQSKAFSDEEKSVISKS